MPAATRATLALAAAFALAAAAFDSASLYVPAVALALVVAGSRLWVVAAARRARLERMPAPWTIVEGNPYPLEVIVRAGRVPLPGGRIVHPLAERPAPIAPRSPIRARLELGSLRRGRQVVKPPMVALTDPLGLHTAEVRGGEPSQVLVLPRIEPVVVREGAGGGSGNGVLDGLDGVGAAGLGTRPIDFEVDGLRPYRHGSPASRVHWPTVARLGEMVEHRLVAGGDASPFVVLDSSRPTDSEALDRAVRAAASLCVHLAPASGCALLLAGERSPRRIDPQLYAWPQAHARLAIVEGGEPPPAIRRASGAEVVFWVTAADAPPFAARALGGRGCYLVSASRRPGVETAFTVAGCHGQRLGAGRARAAGIEAGAV
jgi:uncharacterized protein (DUF58 family)